jgi:hypothetical protein
MLKNRELITRLNQGNVSFDWLSDLHLSAQSVPQKCTVRNQYTYNGIMDQNDASISLILVELLFRKLFQQ